MLKISIITPCYQSEQYIEETALSVIQQTAVLSKRVALQYLICDGQSTDRTVEILEALGCPSIEIISRKDTGMYDALAYGLARAEGEITAYLNAGDYYHKCAFDVVLDLFEAKKAQWLTGYNLYYNEQSQVVHMTVPYRYRASLFACGAYGLTLPYVQQESTFWATALHSTLDYSLLRSLKYAGDFYLWHQFAQQQELKIVESYLGGFKHHAGQATENIEGYREELRSLVRKPALQDRILSVRDGVLWHTPVRVKKQFNPHGLFRYDHALQEWK